MFDIGRLGEDIARAYEHHILDEGKQPQAFILLAFLITFAVVRTITHAIRAGRWKRIFHNVGTRGGTHLHHLVPGILLLLASGYLGISFASWPLELFAILFGIGAALTLDEFALWLHLEDAYWAKEGRQSVDAVVIFATLAGLVVLGLDFWVDLGRAIWRFFGLL